MEKGIPFSRDHLVVDHVKYDTPAAAIGSAILRGQEIEYLVDTAIDVEDTPLYQTVKQIGTDLDTAYGLSNRIGPSYIDGAVLSIDIIRKFAPNLLESVSDAVIAHVTHQNLKYFVRDGNGDFSSPAQQRSYIIDVTRPEGRKVAEIGEDYVQLLMRLGGAKYAFTEQHSAMNEGFRFIMARAERAYETDKRELARMVRLGDEVMTAAALDAELKSLLNSERSAN